MFFRLLLAFQAGGAWGTQAATFYLVAYFVTTLGAFAVVAFLSGEQRDADLLDDYRLFWRRPAMAIIFSGMLLSLAGIPPTAGFLGKFYIIGTGASWADWAGHHSFLWARSSGIGFFYYLRILSALYANSSPALSESSTVSPAGSVAVVVLAVLLLWLGVFSSRLLDLIRASTAGLG